MTLDQARTLLDAVRAGISTESAPRISEALQATGDLRSTWALPDREELVDNHEETT